MTLPFLSFYEFDQDHTVVKNYSMWFVLSPKNGEPPAPTNPDVSLRTFPPKEYYIAEYVPSKIIFDILIHWYSQSLSDGTIL